MPSDSGSTWSPPASNSERRLSNSSDGSAGSGYSKATTDSADFLATRPHTAAVLPGKPATNPLQFVRVAPAELGSRAREQLRRAELAKRTEPARVERQEEWQSNLDNWKSSRRKRVEHIIERCVEVRRMENEPSQPRAKSKTFNEMLEERAGRRRVPLPLYAEDDGHDLSDLGIGTSSTKSSLSEDCDTHSLASDGMDLDKNHSDVDNLSNCDNRKLGSSANEYDTCTTMTISSPEPEEYTYEGAIEGYKSRIISQTNSTIVKTVVNNSKEKSPDKINGDLNRIRTTVSNKIEEKVSSFQRERADERNNNQKKDLPKVDIHKRREQFERENSQESQNKPKLPDIVNKKSIKERLSSLERFTEETNIQKSSSDLNKLPTEVKPLKERLSNLEKVKSASTEPDKAKRLSNGDLGNAKSLKERLSSLKSQTSEEEKITKTEVKEVSMSLKERLSCLDAAKNKEIPKISVEEQTLVTEKSAAKEEELNGNLIQNSLKASLTGIENQMQSFCRSLDSLDINGQTSPSSFERVQSFEDFDCADMQNNTAHSDIETEDSGIHTAKDSAPADDIADLTQVASPIGEPMVEISEYESSNEDGTIALEPMKIEEPTEIMSEPVQSIPEDIVIEEIAQEEAQDISKADSDSASNYLQALSQPEELSVTEEVTEIQMDKEDEDTLKSLDNQDTSVIDALELAFQELDSEDSCVNNSTMEDSVKEPKHTEAKTNDVLDFTEKSVTPLYENMDIFFQNSVHDGAAFPLDLPTNVMEPPKEKPPPPPTEDDELLGNGNFKHTSSARRIKKEIRNKRTSFLGIEGQVDDYLDADLSAPRPDITSFLQEETKIEKLLYKRTLSHDNAKLRDSRDSGVDVDRGPSAEAWYKQSSPETSNPHSRQNSEPYTNVTVTSDEEEASKKSENFASNLTSKLTDLAQPDIDSLDKKLQEQQGRTNEDWPDGHDDAHTKEVLRFERELLQLEQEELRRQRDNLMRDQTRIIQKSVQDVSEKPPLRKAASENHRHSMPNLLVNESYTPVEPQPEVKYDDSIKRKPFVSEEHIQRHFGVEESRKVLYEDTREDVRRRPPQPVLPPKPRSRESIEREITMRSSRVPSAVEYANVERTAHVQLRSKPAPAPAPVMPNGNYHPMTRHTLQALSAAPTPKLISGNEWLAQRARKPAGYNYNQHWLIQEAEQRRIDEQRSKLRAAQRHSYHQDMPASALLNMHHISTSQQHLPQEYKRLIRADTERPAVPPPVRPEPPLRTGSSPRELRPDIRDQARTHTSPNAKTSPRIESLEKREAKSEPREDKLLSVSGRRKCSHCGEELGRGAAMIIESLSLCYHVWCFTCAVCGAALGDGRAGADVRVRARRLHCHHCYSGDDGRKYSAV
ncbi:LIM domain only protein 7 isoform X3 [Leguminivora glycinivorella]|uniref:LIM domain only protein 7 isoform X3 n=1 Tax=Leguminivora glycinivorella TaxID=1035111 RepID=UPI00201014D5|nr:LIM domain only protein 7 isoform X3 [Leguminivora glycinivorella]